jgi:hypothetical protein
MPLEVKHQGLAAIPMNQMGRLSVHDALQHKLAVILAFVAFPPAI